MCCSVILVGAWWKICELVYHQMHGKWTEKECGSNSIPFKHQNTFLFYGMTSWRIPSRLAQVKAGTSPIFFQYICIADNMFKQLIKQSHPITHSTACSEPLLYEEQNAVRYAAGYVPRALKKKLENSGCHNKKSLILCLIDTIEADSGICDESQDWLKLVNRGGLIHVTSRMFLLLSSMESVVKAYLKKEKKQGEDVKNKMMHIIRV